MNQPTKEQIQWFWERCGLGRIELRWGFWDYGEQFTETQSKCSTEVRTYRKQELCYLANKTEYYEDWQLVPPIDLNNLFKYAVPKLDFLDINRDKLREHDWYAGVIPAIRAVPPRGAYFRFARNDDPALALFWAIYKAFGGK